MGDVHVFTPAPPRPPRPRAEIDLASEAIRRGVQYLAFRLQPVDIVASYAPGAGPVNGHVARAALSALAAHEALGTDPEPEAPSPLRSAAVALRRRLASQLAEVKAGVTRAPATALRTAYLDALADYMIEAARRSGPPGA